MNNLPVDFQDDSEKLTVEEEDRITIAEECGLKWTGRDEDGALSFIGNDSQWAKYEQECYESLI